MATGTAGVEAAPVSMSGRGRREEAATPPTANRGCKPRRQGQDPLYPLARLIAHALKDNVSRLDGGDLLRRLAEAGRRIETSLSIARLIDQYDKFADGYYRHADGTCTGETTTIRKAMCILRSECGRMKADEFGPLRLKAVREVMIAKGWCRKTVNGQVGRIKRMFKWAAENELVPPHLYHGLHAVQGLKLGRTSARENPPVKPAPEEVVAGVLPHVSDQVAAMIRIQLLTGMRPGEVCIMRTADVDRSGTIWVYRPTRHKTEHHAHERLIYLGPQARLVLTPFLRDDRPDDYLFSAAEAEREWRRPKHGRRKTPLSCGNAPGSNRRRRPKVKPGHVYRRDSYTRAISRACEAAFPAPDGLTPEQERAWRKAHHWHPHQLRHNAATRLRREYGIDAAQVILGHKTLAATAIYAEKDVDKAIRIMQEIG